MEVKTVIQSTQEQAVAAWIGYLNQVRLDELAEALRNNQDNLEKATEILNEAMHIIKTEIIENGMGRGGQTGMHGFIAEVAECGIGNARDVFDGRPESYIWINDNGAADFEHAGVLIQQKFVKWGGHLSLKAVGEHLAKYPDFINKGGRYNIPADHYEKIKWLMSIPEDQANKMPTADGEFSLKQWREVHDFFEKGDVPFEKIEPSKLAYKEAMKDTIGQRLDDEKETLSEETAKRNETAYQNSRPTLGEAAEAAGVGALLEGGTTFAFAVGSKVKAGKHIKDFGADDWNEIFSKSGLGVVKGGIRGAGVYGLTNYTQTPAAVASALFTAAFGVANQVHLFRNGDIEELELIENSEYLCLDAAVSALSSILGQLIIPIPVLGAMIGNTVGMLLYQFGKSRYFKYENGIMEGYLASIENCKKEMDAKYLVYFEQVMETMSVYIEAVQMAFSSDAKEAFEGSISLAGIVGVPAEEILDTPEKVREYFA